MKIRKPELIATAPSVLWLSFFVFVLMLGSYVIPDMVGGTGSQMLGNKIAQRNFNGRNLPLAAAYLKSKVPDAEPTWKLFSRRDVKGRATLLNDMREVLGAALKTLGHSLNSTDPAELDDANAP